MTQDRNSQTAQAAATAATLLYATVTGVNGIPVSIPFDDAATLAVAQPLLNQVSAGEAVGQLVPYLIGTAPTLPGGKTGVLQINVSATAALPDGYAAAISGTNESLGIFGGTAPNETVVTGISGVTFIPVSGSGTMVAGGGDNLFYSTRGIAGDWRVATGDGDDTIVAFAGNDTIGAGGGHNLVFLGTGSCSVAVTGTDTVIGGTGSATVDATTGNAFVFDGAGPMQFAGGVGSSTVVGQSDGASTLLGAAGPLLGLAFGATSYVGGAGSDTVAAFGGHLTVRGGSGPGLFLGSSDGGNVLAGGTGSDTIFGGGAGDVLSTSGSAGNQVVAGRGAETLDGSASSGNDNFYAGTGPDVIRTGSGACGVQTGPGAETIVAGYGVMLVALTRGNAGSVLITGFDPARDFLTLIGFPAGEATSDVTRDFVSGGTTILTLTDGTRITFAGFSDLQASSFI